MLLLIVIITGSGGGRSINSRRRRNSQNRKHKMNPHTTETVNLQEVKEHASGRTLCLHWSGLLDALNIRVGRELRGPDPGYSNHPNGDLEFPEVIFINMALRALS